MEIVLYVFIAAAAIQLLYYLVVFARVGFTRVVSYIPEQLPPVSVIICAHNEAENLRKFLKVVLIQQYPQFEVILVNDRSTDNTIDVMVDYYTRNNNVRIVNIPIEEKSNYAGKKDALLKGIELAKFDTLVLTDADCRPAGTHWLAHIAGAYLNKTEIVLGYSPYEKQRGFLNKFIRYENVLTALQYLGFAKAGLPYMGVGRNLSYKKKLFEGFDKWKNNRQLPTGDDDLFVNAVARRRNTEVCLNKEAFTYTKAPHTFSEWLHKKRRHLRAAFRYRWYHQLLLFLFAFSGLLLYVSFAVLVVSMYNWQLAIAIFVIVALLKVLISYTAYNKLGTNDLTMLTLPLDIFYYTYLLLVFFLLLLKPKKNWN